MMKVYDTSTEEDNTNGYHTESEDEEEVDYSALFGAPDFATFIKKSTSRRSKEYELKTASVMKAGLIASVNNKNYADAAAFLKHGPGFSKAAGEFADANDKARALIDMLTAPSNPAMLFVMTGLPLIAQLLRNHEPEVEHAQKDWRAKRQAKKNAKKMGIKIPKESARVVGAIKIPFVKKSIPIRVRVPKIKFKTIVAAFKVESKEPNALINEVFQDPKVIEALHKIGIYPEAPEPEYESSDN
jgi:hypothetical protein